MLALKFDIIKILILELKNIYGYFLNFLEEAYFLKTILLQKIYFYSSLKLNWLICQHLLYFNYYYEFPRFSICYHFCLLNLNFYSYFVQLIIAFDH